MVANTSPIFKRAPSIQWTGPITAAHGTLDGTGPAEVLYTAGLEGAQVDRILVNQLGDNSAANSVMLMLFVNNGQSPAVAANNCLLRRWQVAPGLNGIQTWDFATDLGLDPGYRLLLAVDVTLTAGFKAAALGGPF